MNIQDNVSAPSYEQNNSAFDSLSEQESRALKDTISRFIRDYGTKPQEQSDEQWLEEKFLAELPGLSKDTAAEYSREATAAVREYNQNLASLREAEALGKTSEEWFAEKSADAARQMPVELAMGRLESVSNALDQANTQMMRTVTTNSGAISQQFNLDGFIAEQHHVNSFNAAAELGNSSFRAEVCAPGPGETYGKNSFDVVIRGENGQIAHQYQFKYGKDAESTIAMIKRGNYNNQTLVVPPEQVDAVKAAFPGKTVVSSIGGTEKVPVKSNPLTKAEAKELQLKAQETGSISKMTWNSLDTKALAKYTGQQAAYAGVLGAALGTGFHVVQKLVNEEPMEANEVLATALESGADAGIKAATTGAVKVVAEKGMIAIIPPGTPVGVIANVVCVSVENVKILINAAKEKLPLREALERMKGNTVVMAHGLIWAAAGAKVGAIALGWIPVVGPVVGSVIGGTIGYMAGSKVGEKVYSTCKKVKNIATETAKKMWSSVKKIGTTIKQRVLRPRIVAFQ